MAEMLKLAVDEKRKLVRFAIGSAFTVLTFEQAKAMAAQLQEKVKE